MKKDKTIKITQKLFRDLSIIKLNENKKSINDAIEFVITGFMKKYNLK